MRGIFVMIVLVLVGCGSSSGSDDSSGSGSAGDVEGTAPQWAIEICDAVAVNNPDQFSSMFGNDSMKCDGYHICIMDTLAGDMKIWTGDEVVALFQPGAIDASVVQKCASENGATLPQ